jgi:predicted lipid carrier protein YhbT
MPHLGDDRYDAELQAETARFAAAVRDADLGAAGEWLVQRTPSGVEWEHRHDQGDVAVRGPAMDLLLVLSRRAALHGARLEVSGSRRLLAHRLEHSRLEPA